MQQTDIVRHYLNLGQTVVVSDAASIHIPGLGSCIGVFIHDMVNRIVAGAHIVFPEVMQGVLPTMCAPAAIAHLFEEMKKLGSVPMYLQAHIVGGGTVLNSTAKNNTLGQRNIEAIKRELKSRRINLVSEHTGEHYTRTASFGLPDAALHVKMHPSRDMD